MKKECVHCGKIYVRPKKQSDWHWEMRKYCCLVCVKAASKERWKSGLKAKPLDVIKGP